MFKNLIKAVVEINDKWYELQQTTRHVSREKSNIYVRQNKKNYRKNFQNENKIKSTINTNIDYYKSAFTVSDRTITVWPPTLMITIWDHKLAQLNSSFRLSLPRAKSIRNWLRSSSATALITASAQRGKRDRPNPPQIWKKQQKQHNFIKTHRFFVF